MQADGLSQHKPTAGIICPGLVFPVCKVTFGVTGDAQSPKPQRDRAARSPNSSVPPCPLQPPVLGTVFPNTRVLIKITANG